MQTFSPGQRCISDAELEMGLGTILSVEGRQLTVLFLNTGETRTYAILTAPLTRLIFVPGDTVKSHDGRSLTVESVEESDDFLMTYHCHDSDGAAVTLPEAELDNDIQLDGPIERLFNGQIDKDKWFEIRYQTLQQLHKLSHSELYGLIGCRTSLIPHQLYIAHEVANRYAPRVLLADEVGLGKTIEAGLILHQQLLTERASRVLIVVPDSLIYQWLVEMLRRFNLHFSIFDTPRVHALAAESEQNPFHSAQLILCSLEFLKSEPDIHQQALESEWDLLVVDEAHHLAWSPQQASPEYQLIEQLAAETKGVLLLTATPEQLGKESHFARLRLLDPDRFPSLDKFIEEEQAYESIADIVAQLQSDETLTEQQHNALRATLAEGDNQPLFDTLAGTETGSPQNLTARRSLIEHLLDRHGTGRILFRNTRNAVKGFAERHLVSHPLPLPESYANLLSALSDMGTEAPQLLLSPELLYQAAAMPDDPSWTAIDPRCSWLITTLQSLAPEKVLVISAGAETALDLAEMLRVKSGVHAAVFHEGLSIIERDRAAAYFADSESGSQVLICSEIGSEGRNFQFAHHMVLFDLPLNPDLLEQRIGRLDRIGQTQEIQIHVPWLEDSPQATLFHWYHEGLSAFEHTCPAGQAVYAEVEPQLLDVLKSPQTSGIERLVETTRNKHQTLNEALHRGRDRLLEYNSCRPHVAHALQQAALDEDAQSQLPDYMERVCDCFGIDSEPHSAECEILSPGHHMLSVLPGLEEDGMTVTYDRNTALSNEDVRYLSWEHPLVRNAMDLVLGSEAGNTALTAIRYPNVQPGTLLVECLYTLESASNTQLQANRYLPPTTIRVVTDENGGQHGNILSHQAIRNIQTRVDIDTANRVIKARKAILRKLISSTEKRALEKTPEIRQQAHQQAVDALNGEIDRLKALSQINANVRSEEIHYFEQQLKAINQLLESTSLRLNALRVLVAT